MTETEYEGATDEYYTYAVRGSPNAEHPVGVGGTLTSRA
jgi:hypothetical protein